MKNLLVVLLVVTLFSCKKEQVVNSEVNRPIKVTSEAHYITRGHTIDTVAAFRATFKIERISGGGMKAYWVSGNYLLLDGRVGWIQVGRINTSTTGWFTMTPDGFPYSAPSVPWERVAGNDYPNAAIGSTATIILYINVNGNPTISVNDIDVFYCPVQAIAIFDCDVAVESHPSYYSNFPTINFYIDHLKGGIWSVPNQAISRGGPYPMIGKAQNSSLIHGQIQAGGKVSPFTNNGDILF
jgi:hypothetical protein